MAEADREDGGARQILSSWDKSVGKLPPQDSAFAPVKWGKWQDGCRMKPDQRSDPLWVARRAAGFFPIPSRAVSPERLLSVHRGAGDTVGFRRGDGKVEGSLRNRAEPFRGREASLCHVYWPRFRNFRHPWVAATLASSCASCSGLCSQRGAMEAQRG